MFTVLLPHGVNRIAVKYIYIYIYIKNSLQDDPTTAPYYSMTTLFHIPISSVHHTHHTVETAPLNEQTATMASAANIAKPNTRHLELNFRSKRVQLISRNETSIRDGLWYLKQNNGDASHNSMTFNLAKKVRISTFRIASSNCHGKTRGGET
jgi:hypothetical protein